jgi:hypothetical protein
MFNLYRSTKKFVAQFAFVIFHCTVRVSIAIVSMLALSSGIFVAAQLASRGFHLPAIFALLFGLVLASAILDNLPSSPQGRKNENR